MNDAIDQVLHALFCLSQTNKHVSVATLAVAAGVTPTTTVMALLALEVSGLVDSDRVRLTMAGLVAAVGLDTRRLAPIDLAPTADLAVHMFS